MATKIRIRRGNFADLPDLDEAELGYVKDRGTVYIGTDSDNNILLNPVQVADDGYTLDGYLYPAVDNVHGLGTPDKRWQSISVGPGSIHIISKDSDSGYINKSFTLGIDSGTGQLQVIDGDTVTAYFGQDGVRGIGGNADGYGGYFTGGTTNGIGLGVVGTGTGHGAVISSSQTNGGHALIIQGDTTSPQRSALRIVPQDSAPIIGDVGDLYVNSNDSKLYMCTNSNPVTWTVVGSQT